MAKRIFLFFLICFTLFSLSIQAQNALDENAQYEYDALIAEMDGPGAPQIMGKDVIFTAERSSYHFVGIAFDFEEYKVVHPFKIRKMTDADGEVTNSWFFYILTPPENLTSISYRLILDGLWTTDPLNSSREYDTTLGVTISKLAIDTRIPPETYQPANGSVHFVYKGESGQSIRLGGTFTNWDSWIYYLTETAPGLYEIDIPLAAGTYYYTFFRGITALVDTKNPIQAYTQDGRVASVIQVK